MLMAGLDGIENRLDPGDPLDKDIYSLTPEELKDVPPMPGSLDEALDNLKRDHEFLLKGDVFTEDVIETWIEYKTANEVERDAPAPASVRVPPLLRRLIAARTRSAHTAERASAPPPFVFWAPARACRPARMKGFVSFLLKSASRSRSSSASSSSSAAATSPVDAAALRSAGHLRGRESRRARHRRPAAGAAHAAARCPPPRLPETIDRVCVDAAERAVFVRTADGSVVRFKPIRHCGEGGLTTVYSPGRPTTTRRSPIASASGTV